MVRCSLGCEIYWFESFCLHKRKRKRKTKNKKQKNETEILNKNQFNVS